MNDLSGTDGSEVAVALVGEYEGVLADDALCAGCACGCTAVSGFVHIAVKVIICKYGAANRCYADDLTFFDNAFLDELINGLSYQTVDNAVVAAGAVVESLVGKEFGFLKYYGHFTYPPSCS